MPDRIHDGNDDGERRDWYQEAMKKRVGAGVTGVVLLLRFRH
jgi:hypothetical protein